MSAKPPDESICRLTWGCISITICDQDVLVTLGSRTLLVVLAVSRVPVPGTNSNIRLAIGKGTDQFLQLRAILDRTNPLDLAMAVSEDAAFELVAKILGCFVPGGVHVLHEVGISLEGFLLASMHGSDVTTSADDVAHVEEVVS